MKIQLDSSALAALFPEGSEARVELQRAVVAEFLRRWADKDLKGEFRNYLEGERRVILAENRLLIEKHFKGSPFSLRGLEVREESNFKELLQKELERLLGEDLKAAAKQYADSLRGAELEHRFHKLLDQVTHQYLKDKVDAVFNNILKESRR